MNETLTDTLSAAVPLWIEVMKKLSWEERKKIASECSQIAVAEHGDNILFRGHKEGETAAAFNALARGIAVLSFCPGGVTLFGMHFETEVTP